MGGGGWFSLKGLSQFLLSRSSSVKIHRKCGRMDQASYVSFLLPVSYRFCLSPLLSSSTPFITVSLVTDHTPIFIYRQPSLLCVRIAACNLSNCWLRHRLLLFYVFFFHHQPTNQPTTPPKLHATRHITQTCSSPAPPTPAPSRSPPSGEGGDGGLEQQDPEDNRLWAGPRVAPHHQDECCRHLRLDVARSHPIVHVLQG